MAVLAALFSFSLLLKSGPEPNTAMPCVLGALGNINSIKLKMGQSPDSGRQEARWDLGSKGQAGMGIVSQSTSRASCKRDDPESRLTGAHLPTCKGSRGLQDSLFPLISTLPHPTPPLPSSCQISNCLLCSPTIHFSPSFNLGTSGHLFFCTATHPFTSRLMAFLLPHLVMLKLLF